MENVKTLSEIAKDTLTGLSSDPKFLLPKYFYDDAGSRIFQDIMNMEEYYLTDCEMEIFETSKEHISNAFGENPSCFDLVELGSGDGLKTKVLLKHLVKNRKDFRYIPIDISQKANEELVQSLNEEIPGLSVREQTGDYFQKMKQIQTDAANRKIVLFLGSNIGNFSKEESNLFITQLGDSMRSGDQLMIGFDLKKSANVIMRAYDDPHGHTRRFNLNLLTRLNLELDADFNEDNFEHHTSYDPLSGEVRSYLLSKNNQTVRVGELEKDFCFRQWEAIFMERSRKFDLIDIERLAALNGFKVKRHFLDNRQYFADSLWTKI